MSDEQINHRIAELCGWTEIRNSVYRHHKPWGHPPLNRDRIKLLPDYCTDLNEMHEAEMTLTKAQWVDFVQHLTHDWISLSDAWKDVCHATARQRAEAFLRTLGEWEEATDKESLTVESTTEQSSAVHIGDTTEMGKEKQK